MHTGMSFSTKVAIVGVTEEEEIGTGALEGKGSLYTLM
jgi:hypothetical protein